MPQRNAKKRKQSAWTKEEDRLLIEIRPLNKGFHWSSIEPLFPGRVGKQIRERWVNQLDPKISHKKWTEEEDWTLFVLQRIYGNSWSRFREYFPNRTDNQIKNHWNTAITSKLSTFLEKIEKDFGSRTLKNGEKEFSSQFKSKIFSGSKCNLNNSPLKFFETDYQNNEPSSKFFSAYKEQKYSDFSTHTKTKEEVGFLYSNSPGVALELKMEETEHQPVCLLKDFPFV